jgi:hypothetical protein
VLSSIASVLRGGDDGRFAARARVSSSSRSRCGSSSVACGEDAHVGMLGMLPAGCAMGAFTWLAVYAEVSRWCASRNVQLLAAGFAQRSRSRSSRCCRGACGCAWLCRSASDRDVHRAVVRAAVQACRCACCSASCGSTLCRVDRALLHEESRLREMRNGLCGERVSLPTLRTRVDWGKASSAHGLRPLHALCTGGRRRQRCIRMSRRSRHLRASARRAFVRPSCGETSGGRAATTHVRRAA